MEITYAQHHRRWTTPAQDNLLVLYLPEWLKARQENSIPLFTQRFHDIWQDKFSYPEPTDAEIQSSNGDMIQARITSRHAVHKVSSVLPFFYFISKHRSSALKTGFKIGSVLL